VKKKITSLVVNYIASSEAVMGWLVHAEIKGCWYELVLNGRMDERTIPKINNLSVG